MIPRLLSLFDKPAGIGHQIPSLAAQRSACGCRSPAVQIRPLTRQEWQGGGMAQ